MITFVDINWLYILLNSLFAFILGIIWFSPLVFGRIWVEEVNQKSQKINNFVPFIIIQLISSFFRGFSGYYLAQLVNNFWNLFVLIVVVSGILKLGALEQVMYAKRNFKTVYIETSYQIIVLVVIILANYFIK